MRQTLDFAPTVVEPWPAPAVPAPLSLPAAPQQHSLREVLTHLMHDRRRIAAVLLLGLLATAIAAWMAPKSYVSEASLLLRLGREYIYTPEVGTSEGGTPVAYDREQSQAAEARILTSRDLQELLVRQMGVAAIYPKLAATQPDPAKAQALAIARLGDGISAELLKGSNLLQVSFKHENPEIAARVLGQLIEAYLNKRSQVFARSASATVQTDFLARKAQLEAAEAALAAFKAEHGIRAFSEEMSLLLAQRNQLDQRQADNRLSLAQSGGRSEALRSGLSGLTDDVTLSSETQRSEAVEHARKLLIDLRLKERDLTAKYADSHLAVQDVRADIARATEVLREYEAQPQRSVRSGRNPARDTAETELLRSQAELRQASAGSATLTAQRSAVDRRLAQLATSESTLRSLERERRLAEVNYEAAAKRQRDELALEALDRQQRTNVSLVQAPRVPNEARSLRGVILAFGTVLSLVAALLTAFIGALLRDTFLTPEELERGTDLPLLATIPRSRP